MTFAMDIDKGMSAVISERKDEAQHRASTIRQRLRMTWKRSEAGYASTIAMYRSQSYRPNPSNGRPKEGADYPEPIERASPRSPGMRQRNR